MLAHPRRHLLDGQRVAHEHHVGARHLDLPDLGALETQHRLEHSVLDLGEMAFLTGNRKQETHVLRARRRGGPVQGDAAQPGDQLGEAQQRHQHRGQQNLEHGDGHDDAAGERLGVAARQGLWCHLAEHEHGQRGDSDRDPDTLVAVKPEGKLGGDRRDPDVDHGVTHQERDQDTVGAEAPALPRPAHRGPALLREACDPRERQRGEGGLHAGEEGGEDEAHEQQHDRGSGLHRA